MDNELLDKVFNEDIFKVLKKIPDNSIDCVYGDPDYNVGIKYLKEDYTMEFSKYVDWYIKLSKECYRVLKDTGNMFMINYPKQNAYLRVKYLDDVFYEVNDYVWVYNSNIGQSPRRFTTAHRSILHCRKTKANNFYKNNVALPYKNLTDKRIKNNIKNGSLGIMPYSWFYFNLVKNVSKEKTLHSCQIPIGLSEMLIKASTQPLDTVLILFGGSGSEIMVCEKFKRHYISAEINKVYFDLIQKRLTNNGIIAEEFKLKNKNNFK
jgi:DNA modification methylase